MRDSRRIIPMLRLVQSIWTNDPDLRLGQLITIAANLSGTGHYSDVFYLEDTRLEEGLREMDREERKADNA